MIIAKGSGQPSFVQLAKRERGYTLIEFVMVLMVVSIVGSVTVGLYLSTVKWVNQWQVNLEIENSGHLLMSQLSRDLRHADFFKVVGDSLWSIQSQGKSEILYLVTDSTVFRNDVALGRNYMKVQQFSVGLDSSSTYNDDRPFEGDDVRIVTIGFQFGLEKSMISLRSKIKMRQQKPWPQHSSYADTIDMSS